MMALDTPVAGAFCPPPPRGSSPLFKFCLRPERPMKARLTIRPRGMNKIARPETGDDFPDTPSVREDESAPRSLGEPPRDMPAAAGSWLGTGWRILRSPLANLIGPIITVLFALIAIAIIRETFRDVVVIQPIGVPAALVEEGYSPGIVAQRLVDQIARINHQIKISGRPFLKPG